MHLFKLQHIFKLFVLIEKNNNKFGFCQIVNGGYFPTKLENNNQILIINLQKKTVVLIRTAQSNMVMCNYV